jgi:transcriptional regulator with XRE-family HTH domain
MRCQDIMLTTIHGLQALEAAYSSKMEMFRSVARQSGVSLSLVSKVFYGQRSNPTISTLDRLADSISLLAERKL